MLTGRRGTRRRIGDICPVHPGQQVLPGRPVGAVIPVQDPVVAFEHGSGHQPVIILPGGQQVTDADVARPDPVTPRNPVRCEQGTRAWQQNSLADRDQFGTRCPGDGDRPPPARVGGVKAVEQVRDDAVAVDLDAAVRADLAGSGQFLGRGAGQVNGLRACLVGFPGAGADRAHVQ